ncbi:lantibiotic dehydratase C-terminal domain-containing protein [Actinomadura litoris]|uniref:Thiopeptide-type bacteriocin biosynthesis domain-containing protein n=1 Tax=Actinomadura litoris TaxID=2678616 RepID=A0A7K1KT11_9ACTN|nr:lantibiotic dehydratase C-terminal domain-containing protein [Actinomadura litoris]MUN35309.1 hypothetical protein [Actinomadura litoris]
MSEHASEHGSEHGWVSLHAFHQGDQDRLLREAVAPLARELTDGGRIAGWFFLRYWDGGPHVRLRALPSAGTPPEEIEQAFTKHVGAYLRDHPSEPSMGEDEYARTAEMLASWEEVEPGFATLQPNDTVVPVPYRREHDRYGYGAAIEAVERHFTDSSELAMRLLVSGASAGERSTAAFAMLLLAWLTCEPDPARLVGWISSAPRREDPAAPLAPPPEPDAERLDKGVAVARRMRALTTLDPGHPGKGLLVEWLRSVRTLRGALQEELDRGALRPPPSGWEGPGRVVADLSVLTVVDICAHLVCNRLAVDLPAEIGLRRLAVAALESITEKGS